MENIVPIVAWAHSAAMRTVAEAMTHITCTVGTQHTLLQAARRMIDHGTGAAVVIDSSLPGPGIISERDLLRAVARGASPAHELVENHMSAEAIIAMDSWPLDRATGLMIRSGVRHVLVMSPQNDYPVGIVSMRDILRVGALETANAPAAPSQAPAPTS